MAGSDGNQGLDQQKDRTKTLLCKISFELLRVAMEPCPHVPNPRPTHRTRRRPMCIPAPEIPPSVSGHAQLNLEQYTHHEHRPYFQGQHKPLQLRTYCEGPPTIGATPLVS